jgi:hypothetical protein
MFYCIVAHLSTITLSQLGEDAEVGVGFTYRGSSHHRNGAARHVIDMVRQYRLLSKLGEYCTALKGTVRPVWICIRVVSLESPLKAHQPL